MTKPRDVLRTKLYAQLWEDYSAQIETIDDGLGCASPEKREEEIQVIQDMFRKDKKYKLLVKHNFQPPNCPRSDYRQQADLDSMVESNGH